MNSSLPLRAWLLERVRAILTQEEAQDASHDFDHVLRVISLAERIQQHERGDLPTIWAAVAFHDLGQERERRDGAAWPPPPARRHRWHPQLT